MKHALLFVMVSAVACSPRDEDVLTLNPATGNEPLPADADDANPSLCTTANVALCDGFETTPVQSPPWYFVNLAASVTLDDEHVYRGNQALHVRSDAQNGPTGVRQGELTETDVSGAAVRYARWFMYVPSPMPQSYLRIAGMLQADSPAEGPQLFLSEGYLSLEGPGVPTGLVAETPLPLDRWICLEWKLDQDATYMTLSLDGDQIGSLTTDDVVLTDPPPGRFSFGIAYFSVPQVLPVVDIWFDELALDFDEIGCQR